MQSCDICFVLNFDIIGATEGSSDMQQIRPISDLRTKLTEINRTVTEDHNPIILTKNGYGHMVVMSYKDYGRLMVKHELYHSIDEGCPT